MGGHRQQRNLTKKYFYVNKNGTITKIIDTLEEYKSFVSSEEFIYSVLVDESLIVRSDASLEMQFLPRHESWDKGAWPDKQYQVQNVIFELESGPIDQYKGVLIGGGLNCPKCGKKCTSMSGYSLHLKTCNAKPKSENGVIYSCNVCGKKTVSRFGLTNHMKSAHPGISI